MRLEPLKVYRVNKTSSDGSVDKGDIVWISQNGALVSAKNRGWLEKEEWDQPGTNDFNAVLVLGYYIDVCNGNEEIKKRPERDIPLRPYKVDNGLSYMCARCNNPVLFPGQKFCIECGQKLDFSINDTVTK